MAKSKHAQNPVKGGVVTRKTKMPMLSNSGDKAIVRYSAMGSDLASGAAAGAQYIRTYIPGNTGGILNAAGPGLCQFYSTGKFMSGSTVSWQPSVSFTTSGRVICAFIDNPEVTVTVVARRDAFTATPNAVTFAEYVGALKSMSSVRAFPVWQATTIPVPTQLRRKRFDINATVAPSTEVYDRSLQCAFFVAIEAGPVNTNFGSFHFHDVLDVEGINGIPT